MGVPANRIRWGFVASFFEATIMLICVVGLWRKLRWAQISLIVLGILSTVSILAMNVWRATSLGPSALWHGFDDVLFWAAMVIVLSRAKCRTFLGLNCQSRAASTNTP
jgi:hypothetical protein